MTRALLIASLALCFGCRSGPKKEFLLVADYSGSTEQARAQQQAVFISTIESADPNADFCLFRMGFSTDEVMSGSLDKTPEDAIIAKLKETMDASDKRRGTNFAKMAQALVGSIANSKANRIDIVVATDGGNDYASDGAAVAAYSGAISTICGDDRMESVTFVGVRPEYRASLRAAWSKAGDRLHLLDPAQIASR